MKAMQSFGHVSILSARVSHTFLRRLLDKAHDPALVSGGSNSRSNSYTAFAAASDTCTTHILSWVVWLSWYEAYKIYLVYTHPLEVHQKDFSQSDIRVDTVVFVHLLVPTLGPRSEVVCLIIEGIGLLIFLLCRQKEQIY